MRLEAEEGWGGGWWWASSLTPCVYILRVTQDVEERSRVFVVVNITILLL